LNFYLAAMPFARDALVELSDAALAREVGRSIGRPRREPADSFVLHAPLELAARLALLPYVTPERRDQARSRLCELEGGFEDAGPAVDDPNPPPCRSSLEAARQLVQAIDAGDLDATDAAARWLGVRVDGSTLRGLLADAVVPRLAAAAHGSILLYQLPRVAPRGELSAELLRPLARELARQPTWRVEWVDHLPDASASRRRGGDELFDAIADTPVLGSPGSDFIFPVMHQVDEKGTAADVLLTSITGVDPSEGAHAIRRAAAWSMLCEPDMHTPYGWTHCLTLPQAVLGIAPVCSSPRVAMAIAATYVVGFRAAFATAPLLASFDEPDPGVDLETALRNEPDVAAAAVWHAASHARTEVIAVLASRASIHPDAHYVKYTLACIDAAHTDPGEARLYLAAAGRLAGYWAAR
jgi:hypothetical protein